MRRPKCAGGGVGATRCNGLAPRYRTPCPQRRRPPVAIGANVTLRATGSELTLVHDLRSLRHLEMPDASVTGWRGPRSKCAANPIGWDGFGEYCPSGKDMILRKIALAVLVAWCGYTIGAASAVGPADASLLEGDFRYVSGERIDGGEMRLTCVDALAYDDARNRCI